MACPRSAHRPLHPVRISSPYGQPRGATHGKQLANPALMDQPCLETDQESRIRPDRSTFFPTLPRQVDLCLCIALTAAIFILDLSLPLGYSVPFLYIGPLLIVWRMRAGWSEPLVAAGLIGLTWIGFAFSPPGDMSRALFNRSINSGVLVAIGFQLKHRRLAERKTSALEDALADRAHDYEQLVSSLPLFIWTADTDGHWAYLSPQWAAITGCSAEDALHDNGLAQIHPDDRESMRHTCAEGFQARASFTAQFRLRCADGSYRWYLTRAVPEFGPNGRVSRWLGTGHDIDERVRLEQALERKKRRFHTALGDANIGLWDWWPDEHRAVLSDAWKRQLGYEPSDIPDHIDEWHRRLHPEDLPATDAAVAHILASGDTRFELSFRLRHRDGSWRWIIARGVLMAAEPGQSRHYFGVNMDVTALKDAESLVRTSEERYRLMEAGINDGLWDWSIGTNDAYLSPRWKALLGYEPDELADRFESFAGALHPDDRHHAEQAVEAHLVRSMPYHNEFRLRTKNGTYRWFQSRGQAVRTAEGQPIRMVGVMTDITARKEAEASLKAGEERLRLVLEAVPVGILMLEPGGRITLANRQAERMFGYTPGTLLGETIGALLPSRTHLTHTVQVVQYLVWVTTSSAQSTNPLMGLRQDGTEFPLDIALNHLVLPASTMILVSLADRTERQKAEEAVRTQQVMEQVFQERETLTRNLHDGVLQSMYAVRLGLEHCHGLLDTQPDRAQRGLARHVDDLSLLIAELRGFMEHSDPEWAKAATLSAGLASLVRQYQSVTTLSWQVHCTQDESLQARLSPDERRHLLYIAREAISNIVRHAAATACRIALEASEEDVRLVIADDGRGFPPRADAPTGRGLGNMHARARQLGGTFTLQTETGSGTHIVIHLHRKATHVTG